MTDASEQLELGDTSVHLVLGGTALWIGIISWNYLTNGQAPYGDDHSAHFALMLHIAELWRAGVTDLWWNQSNLGLPLFMAYQPLPGLVSGTVASLLPDLSARLMWFKATIIGLWAAMPMSWYLGGRWMGLKRSTALTLGILTLAVHDLHDVGFGFSAAAYGGLYTQIWGMFTMPPAIGAFHRYVIENEGSLWTPVVCFVLVSMSHLFCGMYAGIATALMVLAHRPPRRVYVRRMIAVYGPALALMAFWLVPLLATNEFAGGLPWKNEYYNGWPAAEMFRHLLGGDIFDDGRAPWLTVMVLIGGGYLVRRHEHPLARWWMMLAATTLMLFMGRTNFGEWYDWIPMHSQINVMRYMNGVHFCGLIAAAHACIRLGSVIETWLETRLYSPRMARVAWVAIALGTGGWLLAERGNFMEHSLETFDHHHEHVASTIEHLENHPEHRFAVHEDLNTSPHFFRDLLPALSNRGQLQSYALGYHATLSTYYAEYLRYDPTWLRLFNVSELLAREPFERPLVDAFPEVFQRGPYHVYRVPEADRGGYFDFVRTPVAIEGGYASIRPAVREIITPLFEDRISPVLEGPTEESRRSGAPLLVTPDGRNHLWNEGAGETWLQHIQSQVNGSPIESTIRSTRRGLHWYEARVRAAGGNERLLLKVNYFPFWRATIDGESVAIDHVAPNFMAVDVPAGQHRVRFTYRNPWWQKLGACLSLTLIFVWGAMARVRTLDLT